MQKNIICQKTKYEYVNNYKIVFLQSNNPSTKLPTKDNSVIISYDSMKHFLAMSSILFYMFNLFGELMFDSFGDRVPWWIRELLE